MIPQGYQDLFLDKHVAHVATKNPDGSLQISIVWIDYDAENELVLFNTARGRKKDRNLDVGADVAISIQDTGNFYRYVAIQGEVVEKTEKGAEDHMDKLAKKYFDREKFGIPEGEIRVMVKVKPRHVTASGNK